MNSKSFKESQLSDVKMGWHYNVGDEKLSVETLTHEYGHILEFEYIDKIRTQSTRYLTRYDVDKDLKDIILNNAMMKLDKKIGITEFKEKYWSGYARSKRHYEWFAESFAKYTLNNDNDVWMQAFGEWLEGYFK